MPESRADASRALRGATTVIVAANPESLDSGSNLDSADGHVEAVLLHRVLAAISPDLRRSAWRSAIAEIVGAVQSASSITVVDVALTLDDVKGLAERSPRLTALALLGIPLSPSGARAIAEHLPNLTTLNLSYNRIGDAGARAIAEHLPNLTTLDLSDNQIGDAGARAIAEHLPNLTILDLSGYQIGEAGARAIAEHLPNLTTLDLSGNQIGEAGARAIAEHLPNLTTLNLSGNQIGEAGARAIAEHLPNLTTLNLSYNQIGEAGARAIAEHLPNLTTLNLSHNRIGEAGARAIAEHLPNLTTLNLSHNRIGEAGARAIAEHLPNLTTLNLSDNEIGEAGARAIAEHLPNLTTLNLSYNQIGEAGARAIAEHLPNLTTLNLSYNQIGEAGARAIAEHLPNLTTLNLSYNQIGEAGARAIAEHLPNLTTLDLSGNQIGEAGARAIAEHLPNLTTLNLSYNQIGEAGARAIAEHLPNLTTLNLSGNQIGEAGARAIAEHLPNLTTLNLSHNQIGEAGARAIAEHLPNLTTLNLSHNRIGEAGARAIAEHLPNLTTLNLSYNRIGESGIHRLLAILAEDAAPRLATLDLSSNPGIAILGEASRTTTAAALLAGFRSRFGTDERTRVPFGEIKLMVLGKEAVGKTTLVRALSNERLAATAHSAPTVGVNHEVLLTQWTQHGAAKGLRLNVWDFGGQQLQHQTHNYFLTERCIVMIVLSNREHDDKSIYKWLETARTRSPSSPIIVVVNQCDKQTCDVDIDFTRLKAENPEIVEVFPVSCLEQAGLARTDPSYPNASLDPLRRCLEHVAAVDDRLQPARQPVPIAWVSVRDRLRDLATKHKVLEVDEYRRLCAESLGQPIEDPNERLALLHRLELSGVVVAHGLRRDTSSLNGLTLLDPNWFTDAVYALFGPGRPGPEFDRNDLGRLLRRDPAEADLYPDRHLDYIIDLLQDEDFKLAFRLPGQTSPPRYLLPEALPAEAPTGVIAGWNPDSLRFRYRYAELPVGLIPRFQVTGHQLFGPQPHRWRAGCTMTVNGCPVLVDGRPGDRPPRVDILVAGPHERRRDALAVIRASFEIVHGEIPECHATARIPLPDKPEIDVDATHVARLWSDDPTQKYRPEGADRYYTPSALLDGVLDPREELNRLPRTQGGIVVRDSPGSVVVAGDASSGTVIAPLDVEPNRNKEERVASLADRIGIGTGVGVILGAGGAALYLLGQGKGWPFATFGAGMGIGGAAGAGLGFLSGVLRR